MSKLRSLLRVGCLLLGGCFALAASPAWITLDGKEVHPTRILVRLKEPASASAPATAALLQSLGLKVSIQFRLVPGLVALDVDESPLARQAVAVTPDPAQQADQLLERIAALRRSGLCRYAEPDFVQKLTLEPTDARYVDGTLWGLRNDGGSGGVVGADISAREAWDLTTGSTNVIVAVIDTGVRYTHNDLRTQMWVNPNEIAANGQDDDGNGVIDDVHGINAFNANNVTGDPMDQDDHGTHVAGTIGAAANNGQPHVGVAWKVRIMACKFLGALGGSTAGAIVCIEYATANGASIMNNSWGGGPYSTPLFDAIVAARDAGILFVAAAGNNASDNDADPHYPSNYDVDNIVAVAALDRADQLSWFSDWGLTTVHLGAPGEMIYSSISASDSAYAYFDGTSMAAPHVAGVAALIHAFYPGISLFEVKERLLRTVVPVPALDGITITGGRVNAYKALVASGDGELELNITPQPDTALLSGSTEPFEVTVTDLFGIKNATVTGRIIGGTALTFVNDGTAPDQTANDEVYSANVVVPTGPPNEFVLEVIATAPGKLGVTNQFHYFIAAPPTNDNFDSPDKIDPLGGVVISNNKFATVEPDEPLHAGVPTVAATLWWIWSPAQSGPVLVDTAGCSFDSVVAVYTGSQLASVRTIAATNDVGLKPQGYVQFNAVAGTSYRIVVGGVNAAETGTLRLRVEPGGTPDLIGPVVQFTSPPSGTVLTTNRVFVVGTATDAVPGSGVAEVMVRINNDIVGKRAKGTTNWSSLFLLTPGINTIYAWGTDYARNSSLPVAMTVDYRPQDPPNDQFANGRLLIGAVGNSPVDTSKATKEFREPMHAGNEGGHSVWYRFQAPGTGVLTVYTTNANFDTLLAAYSGNHVTNLTTLASNDDALPGAKYSKITVGVVANLLYHLAVDGYAGSAGTASLRYSFEPDSLFQLTLSAGTGGRVMPESGSFAQGSIVAVTALPSPGYRFVQWEGTINSTANPLAVVMDRNHILTARFTVPRLTDDFESGAFNSALHYSLVPSDAASRWSVQNAVVGAGTYAARSGAIGDNRRTSLLLSAATDAGVASFLYRVSCEANFDVAELYMNGQLLAQWTGEVPWTLHQFNVPAGTNTFEWRYDKDFGISEGLDLFAIDNLSLPLASGSAASARLALSSYAGTSALKLYGAEGRSYVTERSVDLTTWQPVATNIAVGGVIQIFDARSAETSARFYRAVAR